MAKLTLEVLAERIEAVKEINEIRSKAAEEAVKAALASTQTAITKAEAGQQRVNEGQNEFRATLKDQQGTLMPRAEAELLVKELRIQVDELKGAITLNAGRGGGINAAWGYIVGGAGLIIAIISTWKHF